MLSVQKNDSLIGRLDSPQDIFSSLGATAAGDNSSRGIVTGLIGASLYFPMTNKHLTFTSCPVILRYVTAP